MRFTLKVWRQKNPEDAGMLVPYEVGDIAPTLSILETLDVLNEQLIARGEEPVAFDSDCREGICGTCSLMIDGVAHGPLRATTACQLYMRNFRDGQEITIEPWRAKPFRPVRDLVVDRSALDRIMEAGGFISVGTGGAPDANVVPVAKEEAETAFQAATCIGCGACVASCPNGSAMLFIAAKAAHLAHLPQGQPERIRRTIRMVEQMDQEGFGSCTNHYECEAVCPKEIPARFIAELNRDFLKAALTSREFRTLPPPVEAEESEHLPANGQETTTKRPPVDERERRGVTAMTKGRHIRHFDYVNQPYEKVRNVLMNDPAPAFSRATKRAATRAESVASQLHVNVGALEVGTDVDIVVNSVEETPASGNGKRPPVTRIRFEWSAREKPHLFPLMHAELAVYPLTGSETQLDFSGQYEAPLGLVGKGLDAVIGNRIADASIHRFVSDVAEHLRTTLA